MRTVIVGAGSLGCLFAAILTEGGADILLYDLNQKKVEHINKRGILVRDINGEERRVAVKAISDLAEATEIELILILVKSYNTNLVAQNIAKHYHPEMKILTLQNGLGNVEIIRTHIPEGKVFAGVTYQGAMTLDWGYVYHTGNGLTIIAPCENGELPISMDLARFFNNFGVSAGATSDFDAISWKKLVVNSAINPVSAIHHMKNGDLPKDPDAVRDMASLVVEGVTVAQKVGVPLNYGEMWGTVLETCRETAENKSSMLVDIESARQTEIEAINGSIIRIGEKYGLDTPTNTAVFRKVMAMQREHTS